MKEKEKHRFRVVSISFAIFLLLILLSTPLIMNGIYRTGEFSAAWIGFWGSFAGGILGTLGVIYVAFLQNKLQRELNEQQSTEQRKMNEAMMSEQRNINNSQLNAEIEKLHKTELYNKNRLKIEMQKDLLEQYLNSIKEFDKYLNQSTYIIIDILTNLKVLHDVKEMTQNDRSSLESEIKKLQESLRPHSGTDTLEKYEMIKYLNIILRDFEFDLQDTYIRHNISNVGDIINYSVLEFISFEKFMEKFLSDSDNKVDHVVPEGLLDDFDKIRSWNRQQISDGYLSLSFLIKKLENI